MMHRNAFTIFCGVVLIFVFTGISCWAQTTLVPTGSTWKYLDDGSNQGTAWRNPGFSDSGWASGSAQLGYGDGDEATVVSYGPDPNNKYTTTYFRYSFDVPDPSIYPVLTVRVLRDDGAVVYLNGTEIFRTNMPGGTITYTTFAASVVGGGGESTFYETSLSSSALVTGPNVLAVEIHQANLTSSDISFDLELIGSPIDATKGPYLIYPAINTQMTVLWQLNGTDTCTFEWGTDTGYSDGNVVTSEYGGDHQHTHTITGLTPGEKYYYRLTVGTNQYTGSFLAAPEEDELNLTFLAYGDTRSIPTDHNAVCSQMLSAIAVDPTAQTFLLHAGDWVNDGDEESDWTNEFFPRNQPGILNLQAGIPFQGCIGNHEAQALTLYPKYYPYPYVADRYWSFDYGPVHVAVVDQYVDYSPGSAQLTWLENDLAATLKLWKFLIFHEPGYSAGGGHANNTAVQSRIQPLCETYGVDIVFAGHNHYYARCEVNGVVHITTGGGGAPLATPDLGFPYVIDADRANHFCKIEIEGAVLAFTAIDRNGDQLDRFIIRHATATSADNWKFY